VHAGGLEDDGRALLVAGRSGSGKTTLSVALARTGLGFLGDDTLFLDADGRVRAFPDLVDLSEESLGLLGLTDARRTRLAGRPKWQLEPSEVESTAPPGVGTPALLVFPRLSAGQPRVEQIRGDDALLELLGNVVMTDAASTQRHLDALGVLASVPAYRLHTGDDLPAATAAVRALFCS
jgi:hypothetical protein